MQRSSRFGQPVVRALVVDDSALMRQLLTQILSSDPGIEVVGTAPDPIRAWQLVQTLRPDVITLDVEMPRMDGLAFLERLMRAHPMPVLMVSSLTERGCQTTLRALELGAVDVVTKPKIDVARGVADLAGELVRKVKAAGGARPRARARMTAATAVTPSPRSTLLRPEARSGAMIRTTDVVFALGASTGGTEALREVLVALPPDAPGVVIVQHMPEAFTRAFAERLDGLSRIQVRQARDGDAIRPGLALIAPGGTHHMEVVRSGAHYSVRLIATPPVNHHRPSVDVLFRSCAHALGSNAVGAILTGMGGDGAAGLLAMRRAGARTIAQDEASCVVFGMPREAILAGAAEHVCALDHVAPTLLRLAHERPGDRVESGV
jgi:two-component system chemotaxis response regulator CheB